MAFVPSLNTAQIEMRGRAHVERVENTLYFYKVAGAMTQADLDALTLFMSQEYLLAWKAQLPSDYVHAEVYGTDLTTQTSFTSTNTAQANTVGTLAGAALPGNCSFCISFRTPNRGRSGRGRNYWALLIEGDVTSISGLSPAPRPGGNGVPSAATTTAHRAQPRSSRTSPTFSRWTTRWTANAVDWQGEASK